MAKTKYVTDISPSKLQKVDPTEQLYYQFCKGRTCGHCTHFKSEPWSIRTGVCDVFLGVVQRHWECVLDENGKLRVTRQKVI